MKPRRQSWAGAHPCAGLILVITLFCLRANAQTWPPATVPALPSAPEAAQVTVHSTPMNLLKDQGAIWSSPARVRDKDFRYLVPLGLLTAVTITTDHQAMSDVVSHNQSFNNSNSKASNVLLAPFIAAPVVMYAAGHLGDSDHARETGILGGEAMVDSLVVDEAMKLISMRERPIVDNARGKWFRTSVGTDSSFPSTHSMIAWSSAAVLANEYPGRLNALGIYGVATGVSLTRVLGQDHFPSDVLVGSAFGWMIGHYVYKRHHSWHIPISR
ncbi:MAG TPA: phosphatase PAP2 family protein [Terracidiphilus sp.]